MIPSRNWFPSSLAERAAWMQNFTTEFGKIATSLGFTPLEVGNVEGDNTAFQWLAQIAVTVDSYQKAMTAYRKSITEGDISSPAVELPLPPTYPVTPPTVDPGLFERLDNLVKRIRVAPSYSPEDGAALGIIPSTPPAPEPETMKPTLKLLAEPGNVIVVDFVRGKTDGIDVQMQLDGSETWESAGKFFKSPAQIVVPSGTMAAPRAVKLRARYLQGNTTVGQYSDIAQISSIP